MKLNTPDAPKAEKFTDATAAVDRLTQLYEQATNFLRDSFEAVTEASEDGTRIRAYYPEIRFTTLSYAHVDSRLSFGHVSSPGGHELGCMSVRAAARSAGAAGSTAGR